MFQRLVLPEHSYNSGFLVDFFAVRVVQQTQDMASCARGPSVPLGRWVESPTASESDGDNVNDLQKYSR